MPSQSGLSSLLTATDSEQKVSKTALKRLAGYLAREGNQHIMRHPPETGDERIHPYLSQIPHASVFEI
jgi:hypothetical protein